MTLSGKRKGQTWRRSSPEQEQAGGEGGGGRALLDEIRFLTISMRDFMNLSSVVFLPVTDTFLSARRDRSGERECVDEPGT